MRSEPLRDTSHTIRPERDGFARRAPRATILSMLLLGATGCGEPEAPTGAVTPPVPEVATTAPSAPPTTAPPPPSPASPSGAREPARRAPDEKPTVSTFAGFAAPKPATWIWHPPENPMRLVNYVVPAASGGEQADLVVFGGIGGGRDMNIGRWTRQFRTPEGGPVTAELASMEVAAIAVTLVELAGEQMKTGTQWFAPDQLFLAAIVEAPEGEIYITLAGRTDTVEANREAFEAMIRGIRRVDDG